MYLPHFIIEADTIKVVGFVSLLGHEKPRGWKENTTYRYL